MAKQGKKETELAYVRWFDLSIVTGDPCQPEDLPGICENESAGVLVEEDESCITIALDRCIDTANVRGVNAAVKRDGDAGLVFLHQYASALVLANARQVFRLTRVPGDD